MFDIPKNRFQEYIKSMFLKGILVLLAFLAFSGNVFAAPGFEAVAPGYEGVAAKQVAMYGMTPVYASDIKDGTYTVEVLSSSKYFKVLSAQLTVKDGEMEAVMCMSSDSYTHVFMGTGEEAAEASMEMYIPITDEGEDTFCFTVPVSALNKELFCAAFSAAKQKWYDRKIVFDASSLPSEAVSFAIPDYTLIKKAIKKYEREQNENQSAGDEGAIVSDTDKNQTAEEGVNGEVSRSADAVSVSEGDGDYSIEVTMTGGSGRAGISSPTWYYVREGKAYAKLLWSSTYYDYMIVDGVKYMNETTDGSNSTFTIPVLRFDESMSVIADTTAMGDPVEIEYELVFYKDTVGNLDMVPQEAAKKVLIIALVIIAVGGILNYFLKKNRFGRR